MDVIQMPGNVLERSLIDRTAAMPSFQQKGLMLCKVLAVGALTDHFQPADLISFALSYPISSAVIGSHGQLEAAMHKALTWKTAAAPKSPISVDVEGVILRAGKLLLLAGRDEDGLPCWAVPTVPVRFGETTEEAFCAAMQTLLGVEARLLAPLGVSEYISRRDGTHRIAPRYLAAIIGQPVCQQEFRWCAPEAPPERLSPAAQKAIAALLTWGKP